MYDMTVLENAMVGGHKLAGSGALAALFSLPSARRDDERIRQKARESLEFVGLFDARNELARNIPYGHQRLLDVARCLTSDPALLLLDEPTAGMTMAETRNLMGLVRKIRDRGTTVLLVEHDMHVIMNVCERITVLDHGVRIAEGRPAEIQANERVIEAYLGRPDRERSVG
jgi:ABC-type branched-subunit amino acid transport system ATPase component